MTAARLCVMCKAPVESMRQKYCYDCCRVTFRMLQEIGRLVRKAIAEGKLIHPKELECVDCQSPAYCYDHRDYAKPLVVEPVCRVCNRRRGPAVKFGKWGRDRKKERRMEKLNEVEK